MLIRLAFVQLFFTLSWTVYVIFLPGLLKQAGIDLTWLPWILIADQLLFMVADIAIGIALDRSKRAMVALSRWLVASVLASCALFALLPFLAGNVASPLLIATLFVWVVLSSVLRVPPLVLLSQSLPPRAPGARLSKPIAAYLFGIGVASAIAPYLTVMLKNHDPLLPFVLASIALAVTTLFLRQQLVAQAVTQKSDTTSEHTPMPFAFAWPILIAVALFAFGAQLHAAINSAKLFKAAAPGISLDWLMPLFWAGFSVTLFPASQWLAERKSFTQPMWLAGVIGGSVLGACAFVPPLPLLITLQIFAGATWAVVMLCVMTAASRFGRSGREGGWMGATLALFALATAGRIALVLTMSGNNTIATQLPWMAALCWMMAATIIAWFGWRRTKVGALI
jgi:MFS family permease